MSDIAKLTPRPTARDEYRDQVIASLEDTLEQTKRGEVESAIIIVKRPGGVWSNFQSGFDDAAEAVGRLEIMKHEWIMRYLHTARSS